MEPSTLAHGRTKSNQARESRRGQMDQNTKEFTRMVKRTVKENTCGPMDPNTMESGTTTASVGEAPTSGTTEESSLVSGRTIAWTAKAFTPGPMADAIKGSTCRTKSTEEVSTLGPTEGLMTASGKTVSSTVMVSTLTQTRTSLREADGRTGSASSGIRSDAEFDLIKRKALTWLQSCVIPDTVKVLRAFTQIKCTFPIAKETTVEEARYSKFGYDY